MAILSKEWDVITIYEPKDMVWMDGNTYSIKTIKKLTSLEKEIDLQNEINAQLASLAGKKIEQDALVLEIEAL